MRFTLPSGPLCAAFQLVEDVSVSPRDASHTHTYLNAIRHRLLGEYTKTCQSLLFPISPTRLFINWVFKAKTVICETRVTRLRRPHFILQVIICGAGFLCRWRMGRQRLADRRWSAREEDTEQVREGNRERVIIYRMLEHETGGRWVVKNGIWHQACKGTSFSKAKQIRRIVCRRRPSNDSSKPNKQASAWLEERESASARKKMWERIETEEGWRWTVLKYFEILWHFLPDSH